MSQSKDKWFYPLQKEISDQIEERYTRCGYCLWQDVTPDRYYEAWDARKSDGSYTQVIAVAHKETGFIQLYTNN